MSITKKHSIDLDSDNIWDYISNNIDRIEYNDGSWRYKLGSDMLIFGYGLNIIGDMDKIYKRPTNKKYFIPTVDTVQGYPCRVRDDENDEWIDEDVIFLTINISSVSDYPFIVTDEDGSIGRYSFCEVEVV